MALTEANIKLYASERLTDFDDGGGLKTNNEVIDGVLNNVFPDVSRLDRTYGRVSLRKVFAQVDADNVDFYYGSHMIITEPPADSDISVTMFSTDSYTDERLAAQDRLEAYLSLTIEGQFVLFGTQLQGQLQIIMYCRSTVATPEVGDTLALQRYSDKDTTLGTTVLEAEQYVRVSKLISRETQTFVDVLDTSGDPKDISLDVITLELSGVLEHDFPGFGPTRRETSPARSKVYLTAVADAARYYGIRPLQAPAAIADLAVRADTIFEQLVPSNQQENAFLDQPMTDEATPAIVGQVSSDISITTLMAASIAANETAIRFLPITPKRGSIRLQVASVLGTVPDVAGELSDFGIDVTIDYVSREVILTSAGALTNVELVYEGAVPYTQPAQTDFLVVAENNVGLTWVNKMDPEPLPGTVVVEYLSQGDWYQLRDNGNGVLVGNDPSIGTGSVVYTTGSISLTLGALPDVGSYILFKWADGSTEENTIPTVADGEEPYYDIDFTLARPSHSDPIVVTIPYGAGTRTATINNGVATGTGVIEGGAFMASGIGTASPSIRVNLRLDYLPNLGENLSVDFEQLNIDYEGETAATTVVAPVAVGANPPPAIPGTVPAGSIISRGNDGWTFTISGAPLRPGSVSLEVDMTKSTVVAGDVSSIANPVQTVRDDGAGFLYVTSWDLNIGLPVRYTVGTINYTTGACAFGYSIITPSVVPTVQPRESTFNFIMS